MHECEQCKCGWSECAVQKIQTFINMVTDMEMFMQYIYFYSRSANEVKSVKSIFKENWSDGEHMSCGCYVRLHLIVVQLNFWFWG